MVSCYTAIYSRKYSFASHWSFMHPPTSLSKLFLTPLGAVLDYLNCIPKLTENKWAKELRGQVTFFFFLITHISNHLPRFIGKSTILFLLYGNSAT